MMLIKNLHKRATTLSCTDDFWGLKPHFSIFCKVAASRTIPFDCAVIVHLTAVCRECPLVLAYTLKFRFVLSLCFKTYIGAAAFVLIGRIWCWIEVVSFHNFSFLPVQPVAQLVHYSV